MLQKHALVALEGHHLEELFLTVLHAGFHGAKVSRI